MNNLPQIFNHLDIGAELVKKFLAYFKNNCNINRKILMMRPMMDSFNALSIDFNLYFQIYRYPLIIHANSNESELNKNKLNLMILIRNHLFTLYQF